MDESQQIVFGQNGFEHGESALFVKDDGAVACQIRARFAIDPRHVIAAEQVKCFVEFTEVATSACLVKRPEEDAGRCVFLLTSASIEEAALREVGKRACKAQGLPVFLYANAKADMPPLKDKDDARFESFAAVILAAIDRLMHPKAEKS